MGSCSVPNWLNGKIQKTTPKFFVPLSAIYYLSTLFKECDLISWWSYFLNIKKRFK